MSKRGLGKGLSALIPESSVNKEKAGALEIKITEIAPNQHQPRKEFHQERLNELIDSIRSQGVIQPVLVRKKEKGYELIAGERRWRAAKELGLEKIPVIIKEATDDQSLAISLIENIQRENLNPIEEAKAYQRLAHEFNLTQEEIAAKVGKDRTSVANITRLLKLPAAIQENVSRGTLSMGHARALLSIDNLKKQINLSKSIISKGLSVREAENLVNRVKTGKPKTLAHSTDPLVRNIEEEMQRLFGTRVRIFQGKKRGHIRIEYYRQEDLERILNLLEIKTT
ncbi:MAG: ParB/RepB/Spo0J family partition protein [Candidatus Omnitrophica bacterium]|nr:ParB/RepB/Spo0J family partition protein [Candidatus Omnitrophota bacterium]